MQWTFKFPLVDSDSRKRDILDDAETVKETQEKKHPRHVGLPSDEDAHIRRAA